MPSVIDVIEGFHRVVEEMKVVQLDKINQYGIQRYNEPDLDVSMLMIFSDIHRKYIRLREQTIGRLKTNSPFNLDDIRESCLDVANYGGMGVQLVDQYSNPVHDPSTFRTSMVIKEERTRILPIRKESTVEQCPFPIEQIAFIMEPGMLEMLKELGATEWSTDHVKTKAKVYGEGPINQEAILHFSYQLIPGKELELIFYKDGDNWLRREGRMSGISHLGLDVDSIDAATEQIRHMFGFRVRVVQYAVTWSHTNPQIKDTRRYRYRIFGSKPVFGFDLKLIQRAIIQNIPDTKEYIQWSEEEDGGWMRTVIR